LLDTQFCYADVASQSKVRSAASFRKWRDLPTMSALGQKQTLELELPMSALPPKADILSLSLCHPRPETTLPDTIFKPFQLMITFCVMRLVIRWLVSGE